MNITLDNVKNIVEDRKYHNAYDDEYMLIEAINALLANESFSCIATSIYHGRNETGIDITLAGKQKNEISYRIDDWDDVRDYRFDCSWEDWSNMNTALEGEIIYHDSETDERNIEAAKFAKLFTPFLVSFIYGIFWGKTHYENGYNKYMTEVFK